MPDWLEAAPGRLYVVATLLPLGAFALLLAAGGVKNLCRPARQEGGRASSVYWLLGGDHPLTAGAYLTTAAMAVTAVLAVAGLVWFLHDAGRADLSPQQLTARWGERAEWVRVGPPAGPHGAPPRPAAVLELGYRIDHLSAILFAMVAVVGTLIFVFSLGYMADEAEKTVEDHEVDKQVVELGPRAVRSVLPVPVAVRLLDVQPADRRQPVPGVRRLGAGRRLLVLPGRVLLRAAERGPSGEQGVHRQPGG